jgi:hypothetical protein
MEAEAKEEGSSSWRNLSRRFKGRRLEAEQGRQAIEAIAPFIHTREPRKTCCFCIFSSWLVAEAVVFV